MSEYEVVLKKLEPVTVASLRRVIPTYSEVGYLHGELDAYFKEHGVRESAACLSIFHDHEYRERDVDAEAAFPIKPGMLEGSDRVQIREIPGVAHAACTVHKGPYSTLGSAYSAVMSWIEENNYRIDGPEREVYLNNMEHTADPAQYVTEIQVPVEKAQS